MPVDLEGSISPLLGTVELVDIHVSLTGRTGRTAEIYRQLREAMVNGQLRPGETLPATRDLAARLGVARTTVQTAYDQLAGEGLVSSRRGAGTFVSHELTNLPTRLPASPVSSGRGSPGVLHPRSLWETIPLPSAFTKPDAQYDFRTGLADTARFPFRAWRRLIDHANSISAVGNGHYGHPAGLRRLREVVSRHIALARGVVADPDDMVITNGTQQAVDIVARALLAPGDRVAVEDPGYEPPRRLFESLGLDVVGVPVDHDGIVVDAIPAGTKLVYVTPAHHYPLGMIMSLGRRLSLLAWASDTGAAIVEDDYDSEFRYSGQPVEPIRTLDRDGRVIYVGSFSKTMLPTLRLGFVVAPASLQHALHAAKYVTDWHTPWPLQEALATFIDDGLLAHHVRTMRRIYEQRHRIITDLITNDFADRLELVTSSVGIHLAALAPQHSIDDIDTIAASVRHEGVAVAPLARFAVGAAARSGFVFGYGAIHADNIPDGLKHLHQHL